MVLEGRRQELRCGGGVAILDHDQAGALVGAADMSRLFAEDLSAASPCPDEHALADEEIGDRDGLFDVAAGVAPEIEDDAGEARGSGGSAELDERTLDLLTDPRAEGSNDDVGVFGAASLQQVGLDEELGVGAREDQGERPRRGVGPPLDGELHGLTGASCEEAVDLGLREQEGDVMAVDAEDLVARSEADLGGG